MSTWQCSRCADFGESIVRGSVGSLGVSNSARGSVLTNGRGLTNISSSGASCVDLGDR